MKKLIIVSGIASLAFALSAVAQGYTFSVNLQVGSMGADVVTLQTWLIANGFHIPSIENNTAAKGRFGSETKAAVMKYQSAHGVPSTGFVGPLTRASLNGSAVPAATAPAVSSACPSGFVCTPVQTSASTPVQGSIGTPGVAGTLAVALQSTPSNGTSLSKGQEGDVAAYKLQAGASDMQVTSIQLDFNNRLWLYASSVTVLDGSTVVAQKTGLTANDFVDLTAGTQERLTIPMNYVVAHATSKILTIHVAMLPVSDRSSATLGITNAIIRSVDGTGVTDSETLNSTRTWSYTGSNSGSVVFTVDPNCAPTLTIPISTSAVTYAVPICVLDAVSQARDGNMRSLTIYESTSRDSLGFVPSTLFRDLKVKAGDLVYSADSVGAVTTFSNMNIPLPADKSVPLILLADVNPDTDGTLSGISASTTILASGTAGGTSNNPVVEDSSYTAIDINDAPFVSSDFTFTSSDANLFSTSTTAWLSAPIVNGGNTTGYTMKFSFAITAGNNTLYISKTPGVGLATSSTGFATNLNASLTDVTANPGSLSGDTSTYFVIPAGSTRSFTYAGSVNNSGGTTGLKSFQITGIKYGTSSGALTASTVVYYNYAALKVNPAF